MKRKLNFKSNHFRVNNAIFKSRAFRTILKFRSFSKLLRKMKKTRCEFRDSSTETYLFHQENIVKIGSF